MVKDVAQILSKKQQSRKELCSLEMSWLRKLHSQMAGKGWAEANSSLIFQYRNPSVYLGVMVAGQNKWKEVVWGTICKYGVVKMHMYLPENVVVSKGKTQF